MIGFARVAVALIMAGWIGWAQSLAPLAPPAPDPPGTNLPAEPIGPNDLIGLSVYGAPEFSRTVRVSSDGLIRLPMIAQEIEAKGLMPAQLEVRIAGALRGEQILIDPVVIVTIVEYHSRPISVAGAVRYPVTFQASSKVTLLEAINRAQGLTPDAGNEILLTHPSRAEGVPPLVERIPVKGLIDRAEPSLNVVLEGGEEVRVPEMGRIFVVGNVKKPGGFRLEDGFGMTVLKALAMAEGLAPYASKQAYIYRPQDNSRTEITVDLRKILDRKEPDVALDAQDIFYIPDNRTQRATITAIERAVAFISTTASGALIYTVHP